MEPTQSSPSSEAPTRAENAQELGARSRYARHLQAVAATGELEGLPEGEALAELVREFLGGGPEDFYAELTPAMCGKHAHVAMQWLRDTGVLIELLPELDATVAFSQEGGRRHKDVWEHTKTVVRQAVPRPEVRWAAVLHDIGKVPTRRFTDEGRVTFHGHAEVGVKMFRRGPAKRIAFPPTVRKRVEDLIRYHLRPGQYEESWTDAAVRRFDKDMGPVLRDLLDLSRADVTSQRPGKRRACLRSISTLARRIEALREEAAKPKPLPAGLGNALMQGLELPPGKHLATLRDRLEALCLEGELEGEREFAYYVAAVRERGLLDGVEITVPRIRPKPAAD